MRIDRLTSKLQLALSDAQSLAVGLDHPAIEPAHLMQAFLEQQGGSIKPLLMQVGFDVNSLRKELTKELDQLPKIQNPTGDVNMSQDLARLLNQADRLAQQKATSTSPANWCCWPPWTKTASWASCCWARA
jgi:ATP-dependent Clp protease ATP-binding subunit ClpB